MNQFSIIGPTARIVVLSSDTQDRRVSYPVDVPLPTIYLISHGAVLKRGGIGYGSDVSIYCR